MENIIKRKWAAGTGVVNGWLSIPSFFSTEIMGGMDWDSLTVDTQHGVVGYDELVPMLAKIPERITPMVRVPWLEPSSIMKALDAGSQGIICPMINTSEDAENFVQAMRYAPRGGRSFGPIRAQMVHGPDYYKHANSECLAFAMIETAQAIENLDDILATDGLDAVYIGPADLSLSLGFPPRMDPDEPAVVEAVDKIFTKAKAKGLRVGMHTGSAEYSAMLLEKGFDLVTLMSDARMLVKGATEEIAKLRKTSAASDGAAY